VDTKYLKLFSGFAIGTVVGGIFTNAVVTSIFYGGDKMSYYLLCAPSDAVCAITHLGLYTLVVAAMLILIGLVWNIIWWKHIMNQIEIDGIPTPSRYPSGIAVDISNNSSDDILGLNVQPLYIKHKDFPSNLNTIGELEYYSFNHEQDHVYGLRKALIRISESYGNEDEGYKTKFLAGEGNVRLYDYFPVFRTNEKSSNNEKIRGDWDGQIYEMFIEVRGRIGDGKFSKIFKGKFSHIIICNKWKRQRRGYIQYPPKYKAQMQWISFKESSMKELRKAKKKTEQDKKNPSTLKAEIRTKEQFWNELNSDSSQEDGNLTKEQFLANLKKLILTVKKPKLSEKGKKGTSE